MPGDKYSIDNTVIEEDYCIGCGACSYVNPDRYSVEYDKYGMYKAIIDESEDTGEKDEKEKSKSGVNQVCPFSDAAKNEDQLAAERFDENLKYNDKIGKFLSCYVGHVTVGDFRDQGSSGGFGKWIGSELLSRGEIDHLIQVKPVREDNDELFHYTIYTDSDNILTGSKSAYHPVHLEDVLNYIRENPGEYAITALPCFSKTIHLVCDQDEIIDKRVSYVLGLVCGGLKSKAYAESFALQLGIPPENLAEIDFRSGPVGDQANKKGVVATDKKGNKTEAVSVDELMEGDWGSRAFTYKACDYCDDVVGETADVSFGDAWLEEYKDDVGGNNIVITRDKTIEKIVQQNIESGNLSFKEVSDELIAESQSGGLRHRREGLSYRLQIQEEQDNWAPTKRVSPERTGSGRRDKIYKKRIEIRELSHDLFLQARENDDYDIYKTGIQPKLEEYNELKQTKSKDKLAAILDRLGIVSILDILRIRDLSRRIFDQIFNYLYGIIWLLRQRQNETEDHKDK